MARGWESKDVEAQVESAESAKAPSNREVRDTAEHIRLQTIKDLQLSRVHITTDLASATNPHHRKSLEAALTHLDKKIADLQ
jgi:hypothetical protein